MKRFLNILVAILLAAVLAGYAVAYSVRYNESVIVTTLGSADENSVKNAPGGEPDAGLHFKLPWPIQRIAARFDTRVQVLEAAIEQVTTADQQSIIIRITLNWRVDDPLAFYKSLGSMDAATRQLRTRVRAANGLAGDYRFDELANLEGSGQTLDELAGRIHELVQTGLDDRGYGLTIESVGITKLQLPAAVTQSVFDRMRAEREVLARRARDRGQTQGQSLITRANEDARTILAFARQQASTIQSRGEQMEAETLARLEGDAADLALLLDELDAVRRSINGRDRWYIKVGDMYPFNTLMGQPSNSASGGTE
ncbi:MAG: SPFH domain-containing protein [Planctomycetota bacterium]